MSDRYRGRYAAHLSIDFDIDAGLEGLKDFEELREDIRTGLTPVLKELIVAELGLDGMAKVEVRQVLGDLYRIGEADL